MYMMFSLARPDVWPVGDLGVREGLRLYLKRTDRLTQEETLAEGKRFAPYRTAASILLWHMKAQDDFVNKSALKEKAKPQLQKKKKPGVGK